MTSEVTLFLRYFFDIIIVLSKLYINANKNKAWTQKSLKATLNLIFLFLRLFFFLNLVLLLLHKKDNILRPWLTILWTTFVLFFIFEPNLSIWIWKSEIFKTTFKNSFSVQNYHMSLCLQVELLRVFVYLINRYKMWLPDKRFLMYKTFLKNQ